MGKRKSRQVQTKAAAPKCDTVFDCPFCSHRQTVEVQIQKKDAIGKLWCRICGYSYQKRLGPLDKQVDIYCAMIDDAEAVNSKKRNDQIGFINRGDEAGDSNEDEEYGLNTGGAAVELGESMRAGADGGVFAAARQAHNDSDEEEKASVGASNPELADSLRRNKPSSDPLSASQKIAEMGLSRNSNDTVKSVEPEKQRDFGSILNEGAADLQEEDEDSDDLF